MKAGQWASGGCSVTTSEGKKKKQVNFFFFFRTVRSRGSMRDETDEGFVLFELGFGAGWAGSALEEKIIIIIIIT